MPHPERPTAPGGNVVEAPFLHLTEMEVSLKFYVEGLDRGFANSALPPQSGRREP